MLCKLAVLLCIVFVHLVTGQTEGNKNNGDESFRHPHLSDLLPSNEGSLVITQLGLSGQGEIIAFGHFSSQRNLDCIIRHSDGATASVWIMSQEKNAGGGGLTSGGGSGRWYQKGPQLTCPSQVDSKQITLIAANFGDYNHDGLADVMLSCADKDGSVRPVIFLGSRMPNGQLDLALAKDWDIKPAAGQLMTIDYDGNFQLSLIGALPRNKGGFQLALWRNSAQNSAELSSGFNSPPIQLSDDGFVAQPAGANPFMIQADMDGDGHTDLLYTSQANDSDQLYLNIHLRKRGDESPYQEDVTKVKLPKGTGPVAVSDVDGDGHMDIIFGVCDPPGDCSQHNTIHVLFNRQKPYCGGDQASGTSQPCLDPLGFYAGGDEKFDVDPPSFEDGTSAASANHLIIPMPVRPVYEHALTKLPIGLAIGDFDLDSYPDLLLVGSDIHSAAGSKTTNAFVFKNVPCTTKLCTPDQSMKLRRTFTIIAPGNPQMKELSDISGVVSVSFADWFDEGPPGIMVNFMTISGKDGDAGVKHVAIRNGIFRDAYSLRLETMSGSASSSTTSSSKEDSNRPLACNYVGVAYRLSYSDEAAHIQVRSGSQGSQTTNGGALHCSGTVLVGIGHTSNFIQRVAVGVNGRKPKASFAATIYHSTFLFPNSELIFWPPTPGGGGEDWRVELFFNPSKYMLEVVISLVVSLLVLGLLTGFFKWQEWRDDIRERKQLTHLINFDAF